MLMLRGQVSLLSQCVYINPKRAGSFDPISPGGGGGGGGDLGCGATTNYVIWHIRKPCRDE